MSAERRTKDLIPSAEFRVKDCPVLYNGSSVALQERQRAITRSFCGPLSHGQEIGGGGES